MRAETDLQKLLAFMAALGNRVKGAGRIYLTGGACALLHDWRPSTIDIDIKASPEPNGFFEAIAALKEELDVNIELAAPDQFIPALPGWQDRCIFIARHGSVDFYHYDFYSQALSKIERGHGRDLTDVEAMISRKLVSPCRLMSFFSAIETYLIRYPSIDPASFRSAVEVFCRSHPEQ